jgi:hypothetical protein
VNNQELLNSLREIILSSGIQDEEYFDENWEEYDLTISKDILLSMTVEQLFSLANLGLIDAEEFFKYQYVYFTYDGVVDILNNFDSIILE